MPRIRSLLARLAAGPALLLAVTGSARAHHVMDGATPENVWQGFVSGLVLLAGSLVAA